MGWLARVAKTVAIAVPLAAAAIALPAIILPLMGKPQSVIVVFARTIDPESLPRSVTILSWSDRVARLNGIDAATARRLYAEGAALIMPYRKSGCMSYRTFRNWSVNANPLKGAWTS
jgi:hypothetical protein